jgi:hypothetical protein
MEEGLVRLHSVILPGLGDLEGQPECILRIEGHGRRSCLRIHSVL